MHHEQPRPAAVPSHGRIAVAADPTNREIAKALFISEHTVRRHLQTIFTKLGIFTRTAATAFAFQHDLVKR